MCSLTVDDFLSSIFPPVLPQLNIDRIYNHCIKKKILRIPDGDDKYIWKDFMTNPANDTKRETTVFLPLQEIFKVVTEVAISTRKRGSSCPIPTTHLHVGGDTATRSEKNSDLKPDGHVFLGHSKETCIQDWYNSVLVLQFKKKETERSKVININTPAP